MLLAFVALWGTAAKAQTSSTYQAPFKGSTHTYTANGTAYTGLTTTWYVATDNIGNKAEYGNGNIYTFAETPTGATITGGVLSGTNKSSVKIKWENGAVLSTQYYVFFEVEKDGCTNRMALPVTISESDFKFNALVYNVTGADNEFAATKDGAGIFSEGCPDDVDNPIWVGSAQSDLGTTVVTFKVDRQPSGHNKAWQFGYKITNATGGTLTNLKNVKIVSPNTSVLYSGLASSGTVTNKLTATDNYAIVYVEVANNNLGNMSVVNFSLVPADTKDADSNPDYTATDNTATYTIKAMPIVSGFGGI